jgi:hypothetical protein
MRARLEALLRPADGEHEDQSPGAAPALLLRLRGSPGWPSLAGIQDELAKLELVRAIGLPADLFDGVLPRDLERYRRRVAVEAPYELRRHAEPARLAWLTAFVHRRGRTLTDDLVDLLGRKAHPCENVRQGLRFPVRFLVKPALSWWFVHRRLISPDLMRETMAGKG